VAAITCTQKARVLSLRCVDPQLEQTVRDGERPHRHLILQAERNDPFEAARREGAVDVFIGRERVASPAVLDFDVHLRDEHEPIHRRFEARDEQAVVAARIRERDGAGRKSAEAVRHEPFALQRFLRNHEKLR
jgi:hypothetical protein